MQKSISLLFLVILLCIVSARAQYPFEKYKAIKYKRVKFRVKYNKDSSIVYYSAKLPGISKSKSKFSLLIKGKNEPFSYINSIIIKKDGKIFQKINDEGLSILGLGAIYIADINGDSLPDIKISVDNLGNGIASCFRERIYLFQKPGGKFSKISYSDDDFSFKNEPEVNYGSLNYFPERDFNNDGNYEIITCRLIKFKEHNYWTFDIYKNCDLVCVDDKYNYPIMIQYLNRENYEITKKISIRKMKTFKLLKPEGYSKS
jgi:hypothetical protein